MAGEIFQGLTLIKMGAAVLIVLGLTLIAEHAGPRFAGIFSGYPLGSAICLFFYGLEISPEFASQSAVFALVGLSATASFAFGYRWGAEALKKAPKAWSMLAASVGGMACYFAVASVLAEIHWNMPGAAAAALVALVFFNRISRKIENKKIENKKPLGPGIMALRALAAAVIIIAVTTAAKFLPPGWAGVLAAFPMALYPFLLVIHFTYERDHVSTIVKNVPRGLVCLIIYASTVWWTYPRHGLVLGTLEGYLGATIYLALVNLAVLGKRKAPAA
ncbi:MAG: hypothetical protein V1816_01715 [Pseudomonadota bacterium]